MNSKTVIKQNFMFSKVLKQGKYSSGNLMTLYALKNYNKRATSKLGISVSAKLGGAVQRNRVKRMVRVAFAEVYESLPEGWLFVVLCRKACYAPEIKSQAVCNELKYVLKKIKL